MASSSLADEGEQACLAGSDAGGSKLYWSSNFPHKLQRSDLDGSNTEDILEGLSHPQGLAVDAVGGKLYWSDSGTLSDKIQRANLDGSDVEDLVLEASSWGLAVDVKEEKLYWTDANGGRIQRSSLDGSDVEDLLFAGTLVEPAGLALDVERGHMYWCDHGSQKIQRSLLNGSGVEDLVVGLSYPQSLAIDPRAGVMYWTDSGSFKVRRSGLDGAGAEDVAVGNVRDPHGIALDAELGLLFWSAVGTWYEVRKGPSSSTTMGKIQRVRLRESASAVEDVVSMGRARPIALVVARMPTSTCSQAGARRLRVGDLVELALAFADADDAARGPLRPGDVGRISADDRSDKPFMVNFEGQEWWYREDALTIKAAR